MNNRFGFIWRFISRHKYLIVVIIGVLVVGFLDENSFMKRIQYELQINELEDRGREITQVEQKKIFKKMRIV